MALVQFFRVLVLWVVSLKTVLTIPTEEDNKKKYWSVSWNAPFLAAASGYGSEATSFLLGLNHTLEPHWNVAAGVAHGDSISQEYIAGLTPDLVDLLNHANQNQYQLDPSRTIVLCHSEPGAWSVPKPFYQSGSPCPPPVGLVGWHRVVGRTMFETDRLPRKWEDRLNQMDELWVPTQHHKRIFERDGVTKPIVVVGQGIDIDYWDPKRVEPLEWSKIDSEARCKESDFIFLSVFKWEKRKGPDILLPSFWKAFPKRKGECLIIVTNQYHEDEGQVMNQLETYWNQLNHHTNEENISSRQGVLLLSGLSLEDLVRLYRSVDAFVLPSRGEGWGRPYMEAMAMGLPVIATNWSGPTEFVSNDVGYLLPISGLVPAELEAFPNHQWAEPDANELVRLLKYLRDHREDATQKGLKAREHVVKKWSNIAVSKQVADHLERLAKEKPLRNAPNDEL